MEKKFATDDLEFVVDLCSLLFTRAWNYATKLCHIDVLLLAILECAVCNQHHKNGRRSEKYLSAERERWRRLGDFTLMNTDCSALGYFSYISLKTIRLILLNSQMNNS